MISWETYLPLGSCVIDVCQMDGIVDPVAFHTYFAVTVDTPSGSLTVPTSLSRSPGHQPKLGWTASSTDRVSGTRLGG
jgi:hypothetical protein